LGYGVDGSCGCSVLDEQVMIDASDSSSESTMLGPLATFVKQIRNITIAFLCIYMYIIIPQPHHQRFATPLLFQAF
jgi:hypothetical protein